MRVHAAFIRWGFWEGREKFHSPFWPQNHWPSGLQIKIKTKPSFESYYFWTELCSYLKVLPCTVSKCHLSWSNGLQHFYTTASYLWMSTVPQSLTSGRGCSTLVFLVVVFFLKSLLIFFACPMCHTLSNFADIVVWTSGLWGKCNLFTCTFTLNFRFMSPCEIFSGLLN